MESAPHFLHPRHFAFYTPISLGTMSGWAEAFSEAESLLAQGTLTCISISLQSHYHPNDCRFELQLTEKGTPRETLAWMREYTPLVHSSVSNIELYLSEGLAMTEQGFETSWRLDFVITR